MCTSIRFIHTSDWHLGRSIYGQSLLEDQAFALDQLLVLLDLRKPHALLISGDIFDRSTPPETAVALFDKFLVEASLKRNVQIFLIPGNHDSCERVGFASSLLRDRGVTIFSKLQDALRPVKLKAQLNEDDGIWIYGIPFVEPAEVGQYLKRSDLRSPDAAVRTLCAEMLSQKSDQYPAILLCHAFVAGGEISDSEKEIYIGGSSLVDANAFAGFTYTALGHLHKPQNVNPSVRYSGSLLHYSKSEIGVAKSVTEVEISTDGKILNQLEHELKTRKVLRYIEGQLNHLIAEGKGADHREDYIIAGFTDHGAILDAFAKLREAYPYLLHISRAGGFVPTSLPSLSLLLEQEKMTDLELFRHFYFEAAGTEISPAEEASLMELLKT